MCGMPEDGTTPVIRRIAALTARVKVLEDALREYIAAADYSASGSDDVYAMLRFGEADKAARAALEASK